MGPLGGHEVAKVPVRSRGGTHPMLQRVHREAQELLCEVIHHTAGDHRGARGGDGVTSLPRSITVKCPNCGTRYEDWHRASMNLDLDDFDEEYLREASTATCPSCARRRTGHSHRRGRRVATDVRRSGHAPRLRELGRVAYSIREASRAV